jgi:hypothetical protein
MQLPLLRIHLPCLFFIFALPLAIQAQSKRAFERAGDRAFKGNDFAMAFSHYGSALGKSPNDLDLLWKYAESAWKFNAFGLAENTYRRLAKDDGFPKENPVLLYRLGEIEKMKGQYEAAARYFAAYREAETNAKSLLIEKSKIEEAGCVWAKGLTAPDPRIKITHLDKKVNGPYSDFAAVAMGDTLYYSSYRFEKKVGNDKKRMTRLMMSIGGRMAREPLRGIPAGDSAHVAHMAFSPTGDFLVFNYCKNVTPNDIRCELWLTVKDVKGRWTKPQRLPDPVNQKGYTATQPSISTDPVTGDMRLWFASDRPGGKGGLDIWSTSLDTFWFCPCNRPLNAARPQKLPEFEAPQPFEAVNTTENEVTPFFHAASRQLYFGSEGWPGLGGYDIFGYDVGTKKPAAPQNLGAAINSNFNDLYFTLSADGYKGYLSSNRPGAFYLDERNKACCNDIFSVSLPKPELPKPIEPELPPTVPTIATKSGIDPKDPLPPPLPPVVKPPELKDFVGLPLFFDNDEPDKRTRRTTTQKTYEETVLDYLGRQEEYRQNFSEGLSTAAVEPAMAQVDRFFDTEVKAGYDRLSELCELLLERMQAGKSVEIIIKGFTSPRAQSDYNFNLGKRRISSVRNHMEQWADGALEPYIKSGKLRISETSFGETTARAGLSDDLKDARNSVYNPDAARERRVEIVEIKQ